MHVDLLLVAVSVCRAFLELSSDAQLLQSCRGDNTDPQARAAAQTFYLGQAGDSSEAEVGWWLIPLKAELLVFCAGTTLGMWAVTFVCLVLVAVADGAGASVGGV